MKHYAWKVVPVTIQEKLVTQMVRPLDASSWGFRFPFAQVEGPDPASVLVSAADVILDRQ